MALCSTAPANIAGKVFKKPTFCDDRVNQLHLGSSCGVCCSLFLSIGNLGYIRYLGLGRFKLLKEKVTCSCMHLSIKESP